MHYGMARQGTDLPRLWALTTKDITLAQKILSVDYFSLISIACALPLSSDATPPPSTMINGMWNQPWQS
jgi:hypothetical protein